MMILLLTIVTAHLWSLRLYSHGGAIFREAAVGVLIWTRISDPPTPYVVVVAAVVIAALLSRRRII